MKYHFTPIYGDPLICMFIHVAGDGVFGTYEVGLLPDEVGDYPIVDLTDSELLGPEHWAALQVAIKALMALRTS